MSNVKMLIGPIIRGQYDQMKEALETLPKDAKLFLEDEPYCNIQSKAPLKTLKLLLDDPRFVFDDLFIGRQLYFSAPKSRDLVMNHPKFAKVVCERPSFMDYFYERYGEDGGMKHVGMVQRYIQAERCITYWKKRRAQALVFFLYPALVRYTQNFKERYYAPEAPGYFRAMKEFQAFSIPFVLQTE